MNFFQGFMGGGDGWEARQARGMGYGSGPLSPLGEEIGADRFNGSMQGYGDLSQLMMLLNQYGSQAVMGMAGMPSNPMGYGLGKNYMPGLGPVGEPGGLSPEMTRNLFPHLSQGMGQPQASRFSAPARQPGPAGFMMGGARFSPVMQRPQMQQQPRSYPDTFEPSYGHMGLPFGPNY